MELMKLPFVLLSLAGCWRPRSWSTSFKRRIYNVYTVVIICLMLSMIFAQIMELTNVENVDDFSDFYLLVGTLTCNGKVLILLWNRRNIAMMADSFKEGFFLPFNDIEVTVQKKFDTTAGTNTLYYFMLGNGTAWTMLTISLFVKFPRRELMYRVWLPYDCYSSILLFILNYIHQFFIVMYVSIQHVACDSLFMSFLIHTCCQLELLCCRLKAVENASKFSFKKCIKHHKQIYRFADQLNVTFRSIILLQFTMSLMIICMTMYKMAALKGVNGMFMQMMIFSMTMLTEIFLYCWYGNEVKLKSRDVSDAVFEMNWTNFDADDRNTILTVMQRTIFPIEITSFYIATMDLDTFVSILKGSYSAYNMLQQA